MIKIKKQNIVYSLHESWISIQDRLPNKGDKIELYDSMFDKIDIVTVDFDPSKMDGDYSHWRIHKNIPPEE